VTERDLRLGFFTNVDGEGSAKAKYDQAIELFVAAEELGYDSVWVAQSHFHGHGGLPAPFVFLSAVAQRTSRIRIGTALVVLPVEDPLRVAEDASVLDVMSGGRLQLGVGKGWEARTFEAFGRDIERRTDSYQEVLGALLHALEGKPIGSTDARLFPTSESLSQRIWEGTLTDANAEEIGRRGHGLLVGRIAVGEGDGDTGQRQEPMVDKYLRGANSAGRQPRVAVSRSIYPAADRATAFKDLASGVENYATKFRSHGYGSEDLSLQEYFTLANIHYGHPEEILSSLGSDPVMAQATDLLCEVQPGEPNHTQTLRALELTATEVAPALGWIPAHRRQPSFSSAF
jgi:alkanesulfonate monooxygenase SsuD/methylene tetrahydromethanopterin reductase-like flavin-dependent oxidoreductase (luciferase family)